MGFSQRFLCLFGGGEKPYWKTVLGYDPIAYWPLWETSGTAAECLVNPAQNGTYARDVSVMGTGDGIGDGYTAPTFDGTNDVNNIYTAALRDAFNGAEGWLVAWARVSGAGVWTDGAYRYVLTLRADANNRVLVFKMNANNSFRYQYIAGGVSETIDVAAYSPTGWTMYGLSWSASAGADGEVRAFINGAQTGATQTGLGVWAGNLIDAFTNIGAITSVPANPWDGYLCHVAIGAGAPLSPAQMEAIYNARPT